MDDAELHRIRISFAGMVVPHGELGPRMKAALLARREWERREYERIMRENAALN